MADWLSYSLDDFLLFSLPAYYGLFEQINATLWPGAHMVFVLAGLALAGVLWRPGKWSGPVVYGLLGVLWAWTGWYFMAVNYAAINWAAAYAAPAFFVQALLFAAVAVSGRGLALQDKPPRLVVPMIVYAVIGHPLSGVALGRPWQAVEVFGLSPDPLVAATLAVLLASKGRLSRAVWLVPLVWVPLSALTLWMLGSVEWILLPAFALLCLACAVWYGARQTKNVSD